MTLLVSFILLYIAVMVGFYLLLVRHYSAGKAEAGRMDQAPMPEADATGPIVGWIVRDTPDRKQHLTPFD